MKKTSVINPIGKHSSAIQILRATVPLACSFLPSFEQARLRLKETEEWAPECGQCEENSGRSSTQGSRHRHPLRGRRLYHLDPLD